MERVVIAPRGIGKWKRGDKTPNYPTWWWQAIASKEGKPLSEIAIPIGEYMDRVKIQTSRRRE